MMKNDAEHDEMVAAVEAHLATMDWNDNMDAAPKMRNLLLFAVTDIGDDGSVRNWRMETGCFLTGQEAWEWGRSILKSYDIQPTHWRELPRPPRAQAKSRR